jgi:hypothetical protein
VHPLTDGQTLVSSADARFGVDVEGNPYITFSPTDWYDPVELEVSADPAFTPPEVEQPLKTFAIQPHVLNRIAGPLFIEGFVGDGADRSLVRAITLPNETDPDLPVIVVSNDETQNIDTLNLHNDSSVFDDTGIMNRVIFDGTERVNVSGLGMGGNLTLNTGTEAVPIPKSFLGGITYRDIEVAEVLLGQGNDTFTVNGTLRTDAEHGGLTVIHGGGNSFLADGVTIGGDTITVNRPTEEGESALVVFGDTSQDGSRYAGASGVASTLAIAFDFSGRDIIDARLSTAMLTIYGGAQNDTIWGSQAGDHIAGGSGNDTIHGQGGVDHIYGDSGINIDVNTRVLAVPTANASVNRARFGRIVPGGRATAGSVRASEWLNR